MLQQNIIWDGKEFPVAILAVGHLLTIEQLKYQLTGNRYSVWAASDTAVTLALLDIIDAYSHLSVMCPKLIKKLGIENLSELTPAEGRDLVKIYSEQFLPGFLELRKALFPKEDKKASSSTDELQKAGKQESIEDEIDRDYEELDINQLNKPVMKTNG